MPKSIFRLTEEEISALRVLLEYAKNKRDWNFKIKDLATELGFEPKMLPNFYAGSAPSLHKPIYNYVKAMFSFRSRELDPWIQPVCDKLFQDGYKPADSADPFLARNFSKVIVADAKEVQAFCDAYAGRYIFVRYAAQPNRQQVDDERHQIICGNFRITRPPDGENGLPSFYGTFRSRQQAKTDNLMSEGGAIVLVGDHFYCMGAENDYHSLIYVAARRDYREKVHIFRGIVMRRHTQGRLFSSRALYISIDQYPQLESLANSFYSQAEMFRKLEEIPNVKRDIANITPAGGKGVLFASDV